jgi:alkaline phosphatase
MATGHKVNNGVISIALPGDGQNYTTLLEYASQNNMSTGLVTTTPITDATVASFAAHISNRASATEIAAYYLNGSRPNVLLGAASQS